MKAINQLLLATGVAVLLGMGADQAAAQGRGGGQGFDPEQIRTRMLEQYKERLEVTSDDEWKVISERIEAVTTAQRNTRVIGGGGFGGGGGRGNRGGGGGNAGDTAAPARQNPFAADPLPAVDDLKKSIDAKASAEEIKTNLAKVRDGIKEREAKLTKAQTDLKKVLSVRQEAIAVNIGLLK